MDVSDSIGKDWRTVTSSVCYRLHIWRTSSLSLSLQVRNWCSSSMGLQVYMTIPIF